MALPSSGSISLSQVNVELGLSATATIDMNASNVRTLFGKASGAISMSDGYGKSNVFKATISTNQQQMNLRTWAVAAGWNQSAPAEITVASGVYIWSDSNATAAMTIDGTWPGGVTVINNGFIMGRGGNGAGTQSAQTAGGPAISLGVATFITNNSYIGGGGGGGGTGYNWYPGAGGGAGGGRGGNGGLGGFNGTVTGAGGAGGSVGASGSNGNLGNAVKGGYECSGGGGGGRIMPGTGGPVGAANSNGLGGGAGGSGSSMGGAYGGAGGSGGNAGGNGVGSVYSSGGGGGWGASGGSGGTQGGAAGGKAVALNGFTVTWNTTGTVYGAVS